MDLKQKRSLLDKANTRIISTIEKEIALVSDKDLTQKNLLYFTELCWQSSCRNAKWLIDELGNEAGAPINPMMSSLRLMIELPATVNYLFNLKDDADLKMELDSLLFDVLDMANQKSASPLYRRLEKVDFANNTKLRDSTMKRVQKLPYNPPVILSDYNLSCCWCHPNALGLLLAEGGPELPKMREDLPNQISRYIWVFLTVLDSQDISNNLSKVAKQIKFDLCSLDQERFETLCKELRTKNTNLG